LALAIMAMKLGVAIAASMPMIITTIINSMIVNPLFFMIGTSLSLCASCEAYARPI
jgi:hypothetical protein